MAEKSKRKVVPLTGPKVSKGGHNPPNHDSVRPAAPQGSGGNAARQDSETSSSTKEN